MKTLSKRIFTLIFLLASFQIPVKAQGVNVSDSLALVDLYNSTGGPNWKINTNWLSGPVSTWYGIIVDSARVTQINMGYSGNNLTGFIPPSIGNLVKLGQLILPHNYLNNAIPSELGKLDNLNLLNLGSDKLSGSIPPSLGNLLKLEQLILDYNNLNGSIPPELGNLSKLQVLYLYKNHLSGNIPKELGNLSNLQQLALDNNKLTGDIPKELGKLKQLSSLSLGANQLTGKIPSELGNLFNLYSLLLGNNKLSGAIPSELGNLVNLGTLWLTDNQLNGSIPAELGNLVKLKSLLIGYNKMKGNIPPELGKLENLTTLWLPNNRLSGIPPELSNLSNLVSLLLDHNNFTFDGIELIAKKFPFAVYDHQKRIKITQIGSTLSVSAGGTLSNNTYKWYMAGQTTHEKIKGDSVFHPTQSGKYYAKITNVVCSQLTLNNSSVIFKDVEKWKTKLG